MNTKKRILLVEDDPNFGIILRDFLKMNEYDVILAKNGMEGFEKFKKFEFNLCILDVMMPYKDGFTLATEIKSVSPDIPIIFVLSSLNTGITQLATELLILSNGSSSFIFKLT